MTFLLGLYSVLMMAVFPGLLGLRFLKASSCQTINTAIKWPLCFGLSLLINYFLVLGLTLAHLYTPVVIRGIGLLEGLLVLGLYYQSLQRVDLVGLWHKLNQGEHTPYSGFFFKLAWLFFLAFAIYWLANFGSVFGPWDPTVSYNQWAMEWAGNALPILTWHYPQLLPTNWSLTYVVIGPLPQNVYLEAFPAAIQGFFALGILIFLLDAFYQKRDSAFLVCIILIGALMPLYYHLYLISGYADIPVAFFNFGAVMLLLKDSPNPQTKDFLRRMSYLFALAAALTKPAGIYTALAIPLLQYLLDRPRASWRRLCWQYISLVILIAPWYIYASIAAPYQEGVTDIIFLLKGLLLGEGFAVRFTVLFIYGLIPLLMLALSYLLRESLSRSLRLVLYVYTPYFFVWFFGFSYDSRNLLLLWPIASLLCASVMVHHGLFSHLFEDFKQKVLRKFSLKYLVLALVAIMIGLSFSGDFKQNNLIEHQRIEKNRTYDFTIMLRFYAYSVCPGFHGKILTNYIFFGDLPLLSPYVIPFKPTDYDKNMGPLVFKNNEALADFMEANPDIHYLLLNRNFPTELESPQFDAKLQEWQQKGQITQVLGISKIELYMINVPVQNLWATS